jgi:hypothetical protein
MEGSRNTGNGIMVAWTLELKRLVPTVGVPATTKKSRREPPCPNDKVDGSKLPLNFSA